jgi:hypothetical protein
MRTKLALLFMAVLTLTALTYAGNGTKGYSCLLTGEQLPCPKCCPLNQAVKVEAYVCPATGETLPCEKCCPLNQ